VDDEYEELDFSDQHGPSLFDAPADAPAEPLSSPKVEEPAVPAGSVRAAAKTSPKKAAAAAAARVDPVVERRVREPRVEALVLEPASSVAGPAQVGAVSRPPVPDVPEPPLALYRRYRPDTFSDVIGQEHVTEPLKRALENNRVNHAYLFSGPRGCGKTTSARILARALNCEKGPTSEPCGECRSCRDLARGGPGSIDVIEIDAASHGGVDDARDLRERAFFAPVQSRYKIYIVDEAHMVTTAGFNALLKLVEEPPPHVKFIFATTEPEKVIGTIRSRTHHYPFRLVPPRVLSDYLRRLCDAEGVPIESSVLPLVVRAGAGSVRDSLSVLDQLLGGAGSAGVTYDQSVALLGFTPDALLDEIVDAFAAGDGAGVFATIDKVIEVGQDPRRFAEDLLRRLRDLVIVASVPDAASSGLIDVAGDQAERLAVQAAGIGAGELTRGAEVIAEGLVAMRGTTAPRLHLELMCARVLLPGADVDGRGIHARLDRLERRLGMPDTAHAAGGAPAGGDVPAAGPWGRDERSATPVDRSASTAQRPVVTSDRPATTSGRPTAVPAARGDHPSETGRKGRRTFDEPPPEDDWTPPADRDQAAPSEQAAPRLRVVRDEPAPVPVQAVPSEPTSSEAAPEPPAQVEETPAAASGKQGPAATDVRRLWPEVLEEVKRRRRFTWMTISQHAQVTEVSEGTLVLTFANPGARDSFLRGGSDDVLRDALVEVMGADLTISALLESEGRAGAAVPPPAPAPIEGDSPDSPDSPDDIDPVEPAATPDEWRADPDPVASSAHTDLLARARAQAAAPVDPAADTGERDDPDVDDTDAESLLREMLHAEVIDDE
jgi:DNA polymerase III subunit gamma/tau